MKLSVTLRFIVNHPLNRNKRLKGVTGWLLWQIGSRLVPGPVAVPFVNGTRLLVDPGMTGATGNVYAGLHDFSEMSFLLHLLRPGDLFFDIGANIGSYSILASAVAGAKTVALEPVPVTFSRLQDNIRMNGVEQLVEALNAGAGKHEGTLRFTAGLDTMNHVVIGNTESEVMDVQVTTLDVLADEEKPFLIKMDVEGYETNVLEGGRQLFTAGFPEALIMEINGRGNRYGFDEMSLHREVLDYGFGTFSYLPLKRELVPLCGHISSSGNTLYIKNIELVKERVATATAFSVRGMII